MKILKLADSIPLKLGLKLNISKMSHLKWTREINTVEIDMLIIINEILFKMNIAVMKIKIKLMT